MLWSTFDSILRHWDSLASLRAFEIALRDAAPVSWDIATCLSYPQCSSARAALTSRLAAKMQAPRSDLAARVAHLIIVGLHVRTVDDLAQCWGLGRRTLERRLVAENFCSGKALIHLGHLVSAFDFRAHPL